jgi:hypothetical protein
MACDGGGGWGGGREQNNQYDLRFPESLCKSKGVAEACPSQMPVSKAARAPSFTAERLVGDRSFASD